MNKPNFFIVGAPKCGTTAMNDYLNHHPEIFMAEKEIHYFGSDLKLKDRITETEYLQKFEDRKNEKIVGEASVWYLFSENAAEEIKEFSPHARILIILRKPVDVIYSLHSQHLYDGNEDVLDFNKAILLEEQRQNGSQLPASRDFYQLPTYLDSVRYFEQVKRYLELFGENSVHIVLYDDFIADTQKVVTGILKFLNIEHSINMDYKVINANKEIQYFFLHRLIKNPSSQLKKLVRWVLPSKEIRHRLMAKILKWNIRIRKRKKLDDEMKESINNKLAGDIRSLGKLINRDLDNWLV